MKITEKWSILLKSLGGFPIEVNPHSQLRHYGHSPRASGPAADSIIIIIIIGYSSKII